jgi:nitrile hydratase accessory protein
LDGEPVFDQPWQAEALALADSLVAEGVFTPTAWSSTLGGELAAAEGRGEADDATTYYNAVLRSLERLLAECGEVTAEAVTRRRDAWADAYLATPHGRPVELKTAGGYREQ